MKFSITVWILLSLSQLLFADMGGDLAWLNGVNTIRDDHGGPITNAVKKLRAKGLNNWDICAELLLDTSLVHAKYQQNARKWVEGCSIHIDKI